MRSLVVCGTTSKVVCKSALVGEIYALKEAVGVAKQTRNRSRKVTMEITLLENSHEEPAWGAEALIQEIRNLVEVSLQFASRLVAVAVRGPQCHVSWVSWPPNVLYLLLPKEFPLHRIEVISAVQKINRPTPTHPTPLNLS
ncbi:unnamed protein product [Dovyalis caffra]|uniref:Uncharacterized protein n=1 Tax=Dovyalis caffra TaxID=77055 RepID=A0AAV1REC1_9ROSI|nr:unnamed protein product [Dovyalis caffra]